MKYTFYFLSSSDEENMYVTEAKSLNDALSQFAIHAYSSSLSVSSFSRYYHVDGKKGRNTRIFNPSLIYRFWNFYRIAEVMDKVYGIDKSEIL